jgi:hypothetical protein
MMLPPPRLYLPQSSARSQEGAIQVNCEHALPVGIRELLERRDDLNARVAGVSGATEQKTGLSGGH